MIGLIGAMDTLCGQAYGAGEYRTCGILLQRGVLVSLVVLAPILLGWAYIQQPLLWLGQSPDLVTATSRYLMYISPTLVAQVLSECVVKWMSTQVCLRL